MYSIDKIIRKPFIEWSCKELNELFDNLNLIGEGSYG
jgi:hypothetical protein